MKITDVTLTLFAWDQIPATRYSANTGRFSGSSDLGLLTVATDQGIEGGNASLGPVWSPASQDGPNLIRYLKPMLIGQDPLERERLYQAMWSRSRVAAIPAIGASDIALWDIAGKVAGMPIHCLLGPYRASAPAYASSQVLSTGQGLRGAGTSFQGTRMAGVQNPSATNILADRCRGLPCRPPGGGRRLLPDAGCGLALRVPDRTKRRPRHRGTDSIGTNIRWRIKISTTTSSSARSSTFRSWRPKLPRAPIATRCGSPSAPPISCAATSPLRAASPR